ncbi:MAG: metallophosphoesterase family protein [Eubacterium sp.]
MRMIVTSDSHGNKSGFFDVVEKHIDEAELFVNLGDSNSQKDLEDARLYFGSKLNLACVAGNCDWSSDLPLTSFIKFGGKNVFMCHGHTFRVKTGLRDYLAAATACKADIALFGHTHCPVCKEMNGIYFFNPGALADGSYGIIDIENNIVNCKHARIE